MRRFTGAIAAILLAGAAAGPAASQAPPGQVETTGSLPLSAEKQLEVKTSIARYSRALKPGEDLPRLDEPLAVGATVPASIDLIRLPQDALTETPSTTSYRFVLMGKAIAVVEPETRKVVQVIE